MRIVITEELYNMFIEKGYGHKDYTKLTRKVITDKNGHRRTVFVKNGVNINNPHQRDIAIKENNKNHYSTNLYNIVRNNKKKVDIKHRNSKIEDGGFSNGRTQNESYQGTEKEKLLGIKNSSNDESVRFRFSTVLQGELERWNNNSCDGTRILRIDDSRGNSFELSENASPKLFHNCIKEVKETLENGELVDVHHIKTTDEEIGYEDCKCYLSKDGLSGFAITPSGDLISVFNRSEKSGFLRASSSIIKKEAKTLDCFASPIQNLPKIYENVFGFKVASLMDHNMEFDHDGIAEKHQNPKVAFMINPLKTEKTIEVRNFDKWDYDGAKEYQLSYLNNDIKKSFSYTVHKRIRY